MRDAEPLLRRLEALEVRYRELYLPFAEVALEIARTLKALPEYYELQETLFEVNLKCRTESSFESIERKLLRNQYNCVCEYIEESRLVVTNIYQYVEEDVIVWPATRRVEKLMEELFVTKLHRPKLHAFVEACLVNIPSEALVRKIQNILERYGEVETPFRNLSYATLQAICRALPEMNMPIEVLDAPPPTTALTSSSVDPAKDLPMRAPPSPAMAVATPAMRQNAHTANFLQDISPVHLSSDEDSDSVDNVAALSEEPAHDTIGSYLNNKDVHNLDDAVQNLQAVQPEVPMPTEELTAGDFVAPAPVQDDTDNAIDGSVAALEFE